MLEKEFIQRSSDTTDVLKNYTGSSKENSRVYLNAEQAIADFEKEAHLEAEPTVELVDPKIEKYIKNAKILMKHGEYRLAMNLLRQGSNLNSKDPAVLSLLATCLENSSNMKEALIVRKAQAQYDYSFDSLYAYASALYKSGNDQEALDKYFEALAILTEENSTLFELYKNMGNIFVRKGDFDAAEEYYNKAYTLNSQSDVLLVNFGTLEVQRNDFDKSLYCFRKAVEINPENDKAWVGLAMVHNQVGDSDLAWANIESAIDINKKNRTAVHLAANWGVRDGKIQKAIEVLQDYLASVEEDEDMSLVLINLFCTVGNLDGALLEIERVLLWNPDQGEVRRLKKQILNSQKVA